VTPTRWTSLQKGKGVEYPAVSTPIDQRKAEAVLSAALGPRLSPLPPLPADTDADDLAKAVARAIKEGPSPPDEGTEERRPELEHFLACLADATK
jgi:hypothetical protein